MTITYATSKALTKFLGDSAPEPMSNDWWCCFHENGYTPNLYKDEKSNIPAYQLHDLLSRPFLQAFTAKRKDMQNSAIILWPEVTGGYLCKQYYDGGMEAVEKCLIQMMGK